MPLRTKEHIISDGSIDQIGELITSLGWAWEKVQQDYGEDIVIQTTYNEKVEPFRIWLQVKGTDSISKHSINKGAKYSYPISTSHILKWISSVDYILIVLWDVTSKRGVYCDPQTIASEWELTLSNNKSKKVHFEATNELNEKSLIRHCWRARIKHYDHRIGKLLALSNNELIKTDNQHEVQEKIILISFMCLKQLELFDDEMNFSTVITKKMPTVVANIARQHKLSNEELAGGVSYESLAATLLIISEIGEVTGEGCPFNLTVALPAMVLRLIEAKNELPEI